MKLAFAPVAVALLASALMTSAPARAGDDGQASLISGLASTFGITKQDDPQIDYRERSKLVVPRKRELPPPGAPIAGQDPAWPVDVETVRERQRKKLEDGQPSAKDVATRNYTLIKPGDATQVTTSGFTDSGRPSCRVPDPKTGECPTPPHATMNWNPLTWVGLEKKPAVVLGPEPERENLIDPPKGYRAPAEGVGAKVENN
jgi:hypothetical protein